MNTKIRNFIISGLVAGMVPSILGFHFTDSWQFYFAAIAIGIVYRLGIASGSCRSS